MEPVSMVTDTSVLNDSDFSVSVTTSSELAEQFLLQLQKINHLVLKNHIMYVFCFKKLMF